VIRPVARAALVALLLGCQGCALPPAIGYAVGVAGATYGYLKDANMVLKVESDLICGLWGAIWKKPTPASVSGFVEDVAIFCSGNPPIGSTPLATLEGLWGKVQAIRAAQQAAS
jgi:hypothetical protein